MITLSYMDSVHRDGRIWNLSMMVLLFLFPVAVALIYDAMPDWNGFLVGLIATAPMYWAVAVEEVFILADAAVLIRSIDLYICTEKYVLCKLLRACSCVLLRK